MNRHATLTEARACAFKLSDIMMAVTEESKPPTMLFAKFMYAGLGAIMVGWTVLHAGPVAIIGVVAVCSLFGVAMIKPLSTELSATGVSQRTWSGRDQLLWADVTSAQWDGRAVELQSDTTRFRVPLMFFDDYGAACAYVLARLPTAPADSEPLAPSAPLAMTWRQVFQILALGLALLFLRQTLMDVTFATFDRRTLLFAVAGIALLPLLSRRYLKICVALTFVLSGVNGLGALAISWEHCYSDEPGCVHYSSAEKLLVWGLSLLFDVIGLLIVRQIQNENRSAESDGSAANA